MKDMRLIMGMPIEVEIVSSGIEVGVTLEMAFQYLRNVDNRFSTYKKESEISRINRGEIGIGDVSEEMREVLDLAEKTKRETNGYFDVRRPDESIDPSGIVKGWAIRNTARLIDEAGYQNYSINAGGDIAMRGHNAAEKPWSVGIRNPFNQEEIIKVIYPRGNGVATSGSYIRGDHIYNPHTPSEKIESIVSLTVLGPNVLEADRFATGAFAMGEEGIIFIERLPGFEGYMIDKQGIATITSGFEKYLKE
ncbi:MAG: thiamine biosynthesis protein [Parcubacteria group bacterium]|nr:thiamine biosynthesis protein [Parcubacteria group bacterium]